jgi:hypothetical protein
MFVCSVHACCEMYAIQPHVIEFVGKLRKVNAPRVLPVSLAIKTDRQLLIVVSINNNPSYHDKHKGLDNKVKNTNHDKRS